MNQKVEKRLKRILFFFGLVLFLFSISMLIYSIIDVIHIDWSTITTIEERRSLVIYLIILFTTYTFKLVLAIYAINALKHLDEVINPLFVFTIMYTIFVSFQATIYFYESANPFEFSLIASNNIIDILVAAFMIIITLIFKIDDWRTYEKRS